MRILRLSSLSFSLAALVCLTGAGGAAADEADRSAETFFKPPFRLHSLEAVQPSDVEKIMGMSEEQILAAMPVQCPRIHNGCPNCHAHKEERNWMDHGERGQPRHIWFWDYDPLKPDTITCKICGETYPGNKKYPQNRTDTYTTPLGDDVKVRFYLDPGHPDKSKRKPAKRYFMDGCLDTARWYWMRQQMVNLARLYVLTGEEKYARKSLFIFNAYCDLFPQFLMCTSYGRTYGRARGSGKWSRESTRSHRRREGDGDWRHMKPVLAMLADSRAMADSKQRFGMDLREKHDQNIDRYVLNPWRCPPELIGKPVEQKVEDPSEWEFKDGRQSAPGIRTEMRENRDYARIRHVIRNYEVFPMLTYAVDGGYFQGLGYGSIQYLANMRMLGINGYSDPPDYEIPEGEKRYLNYHYPRGKFERFYRRMYSLPERLRMPDGYQVTFNDMGRGYTSATFQTRDPRESSECLNLPGLKHVVLGAGEGDEQVQVHIGFGNATRHGHADTLAWQLWAHGHYLIDDITYPKHKLRAEYSSLPMHNTVVMDGRSPPYRLTDGDVSLYEPNQPGFAAVKVDAPRAKVGQADVYARQLILVTQDPAKPYVIDVFQAKGGWIKDYMLRAPTRHEVDARYSIALEDVPGDYPLKDTVPHRCYAIFSNVKKGDASQGFTLTYAQRNPWPRSKDGSIPKYPMRAAADSWKDEPAIGTKHHFLGGTGMTAYATGIPKNSECTGAKPWKDCEQWPYLVLRHEGEDSVFVAVHEPYAGAPALRSVELAKPYEPGDAFVALKITTADRVDRAIIALGNAPVTAEYDGLHMNGRIGFATQPKAGKAAAHLVGGTSLLDKASGVTLGQQGEFSGTVTGSLRTWDGDALDALVISGERLPPAGDELRGSWIMLSNHGELREVPDIASIGREPFDTGDKHKRINSPQKARERDWFFYESGIGICAEIDRVETIDGKTYVVTKQDHGVEARDGYMKELFRPQREVFGKPTRFTILTGASSVPRLPKVSEEAERLAQSQPAAAVRHDTLAPGLLCQTLILNKTDRETYEALKAAGKLELPGKNHDMVLSNMLRLIYGEQFYFSGEYLNKVSVDPVPEVRGFLQNYVFNGNCFGRLKYEGYLDVPEDGLYTLYFRPDQDGYLKVDGKLLLDYRGYIGNPVARIARVSLEAGLHALEFDYQFRPAEFNRWYNFCEFEWEGPGVERRALRPGDLLHDPDRVEALAGKVQPLQERHRPPAVEYAGRPLWATPEEALRISLERQYINANDKDGKKPHEF